MIGERWARGSGGAARVIDAAGNVELWVLKPYAWPPHRPAFRLDKGATQHERNGITETVVSPEGSRIAFERRRHIRDVCATKPRDSGIPIEMRAPLAEVLKLVCVDCHQLAGFYLAWQESETLDQIATEGAWVTCTLPNACRCTWTAWPDVRQFRRQIATALGRGLKDGRAAVRVEHPRV